jgi:hypothetical protein
MPSSDAGAVYRVRRGDTVVYLMPYEDAPGRRVVYEQDVESFDTRRRTVGRERARTLAESGREVELYETPAWADPTAPAAAHAPAP